MQLEYEIVALIAMIGLSGYFSGLEVALVSIRVSKIEQMIKDKVKGAVSLHKLKSNPSRMMSSVNLESLQKHIVMQMQQKLQSKIVEYY